MYRHPFASTYASRFVFLFLIAIAYLFFTIGSSNELIAQDEQDEEEVIVDFQTALDAYNEEKYELAAKYFSVLIDQGANSSASYANRGLCYFRAGKYNEALTDYNKSINLNPGSTHNYDNRGVLYMTVGKYDLAIKEFERAVGLASENFSAYRNHALVLSSCRDEKIRDGKKALELAEKAYQLKETVDALTTMGFYDEFRTWHYADAVAAAHAELGDFDKALTMEKEALKKLEADDYEKKSEDIKKVKMRLELYRNEKPSRMKPVEYELKAPQEKKPAETDAIDDAKSDTKEDDGDE